MKLLLKILCCILLVYSLYFPIKYFHSDADKKEIKISHILVDSKDKIVEIQQEILEKKILFGEAAKKYSTCDSAKQEGDLGYNVRNGVLLKEFEDAAFNLPAYKVSEPVQTKEGWHLIKVTDIKYFSDRENFAKEY